MRGGIQLMVAAVLASVAAPAWGQTELRVYQTKYYSLRTDVEAEHVPELASRLTLMAEEYHRRTRGFAGSVNERLPVYVFRDQRGYLANGGRPNTAGLFTGDKLLILAGDQVGPDTWMVAQHEAFHQFAMAAIGHSLPIWANEGLAEYFGLGLYTGDDFYTGAIPPMRLAIIQEGVRGKKFRSLLDMMRLPHGAWNAEVESGMEQAGYNYMQAWSMVHFLAHGDNGRYQDAFAKFLNAVSRGQAWEPAWVKAFGGNVNAFQQRWQEYWLGLPENPTDDLYAQATVATITSFFARAHSQRQFFDTFDDFLAAAKAGQLKAHADDWLPPSLLSAALSRVAEAGDWSVDKKPGRRSIVLTRPDGAIMEGQFKIAEKRVKGVEVIVKAGKRGSK